jgi:hypothetical protein
MASCDDDDEPPVCVPNDTRLCACPDRDRQGVQACLMDSSGFGECDCSGVPREGGGGSGGTSGDPEAITPLVGRSCVESANCGEGLTCFTPTSNDFLGGGAPGGYCSINCTEDAQCTSIDRQSQCDGAAGVCIRTCLSLNPTSLDESKCLDRRDVACQSEAYRNIEQFTGLRQNGLCYPQCASDEDCPGRRCDPARGICVDNVTTGLVLGEACTMNSDCAGRACVSIPGGAYCSAPCVFGVPIGCGYGLAPSGERAAGCFAPAETGFLSSEGDGDVGLCIELCSTAADCTQPGWLCRTSDANQARLGRPGVCLPPPPTDAGTDAGSDSGAAPDASVD